MQLELEYRGDLPNRHGYEGLIAYSGDTSYQSRKPSRHGLEGPNAHARAGQTCVIVGLSQWCILSGIFLPFRRHSHSFFPANPGHGCLSPFGWWPFTQHHSFDFNRQSFHAISNFLKVIETRLINS